MTHQAAKPGVWGVGLGFCSREGQMIPSGLDWRMFTWFGSATPCWCLQHFTTSSAVSHVTLVSREIVQLLVSWSRSQVSQLCSGFVSWFSWPGGHGEVRPLPLGDDVQLWWFLLRHSPMAMARIGGGDLDVRPESYEKAAKMCCFLFTQKGWYAKRVDDMCFFIPIEKPHGVATRGIWSPPISSREPLWWRWGLNRNLWERYTKRRGGWGHSLLPWKTRLATVFEKSWTDINTVNQPLQVHSVKSLFFYKV